MATVAIVLNTTKALTNNEHPIALRVTHNYKRKYYSISTLLNNQSLRFRCTPYNWRPPQPEDNGLGKLLRTFSDYKACNSILQSKLAEANMILKRYDDEGLTFSFAQFEADLKRKEQPLITSLQDYYTLQISILDEQGRVGM